MIKKEIIKKLAEEAKESGDNQLAIVLHTFMGARHAGLAKEFALYCQDWAKAGSEWIEIEKELERIKRNN